jgi:multicomponent Na+:H+ antiporter subunit F
MIVPTLYLVAGVIFAISAAAAVVRIIRGPSILDRMLASDVLVTIVLLVIGAEMVINGHTRTIPVMVVLAGGAAFSTVAVARYVSQQDRPTTDASPIAGGPGEESRDG